jgi:ParB family chromosome partitioning protein
VSKRRGLPTQSRMRHDSHFVDSLSERFGASLGRLVAIDEIETNPEQPRRSVGDLSELARSIESKGVLEPILVRPLPDGRFRIIAGERRFRAALEAGLTEVPCIELDVPDNEVLEIALIENLHRRDLHPFEEATGYASLMERHGYTQQRVADTVGKSRVSITEALSLLDMPEDLR